MSYLKTNATVFPVNNSVHITTPVTDNLRSMFDLTELYEKNLIFHANLNNTYYFDWSFTLTSLGESTIHLSEEEFIKAVTVFRMGGFEYIRTFLEEEAQ